MVEGILKDPNGVHMEIKDLQVLLVIIRRRILLRNPIRKRK